MDSRALLQIFGDRLEPETEWAAHKFVNQLEFKRWVILAGQVRDRLADGDGAIMARVVGFLGKTYLPVIGLEARLNEMHTEMAKALESIVGKVKTTKSNEFYDVMPRRPGSYGWF